MPKNIFMPFFETNIIILQMTDKLVQSYKIFGQNDNKKCEWIRIESLWERLILYKYL